MNLSILLTAGLSTAVLGSQPVAEPEIQRPSAVEPAPAEVAAPTEPAPDAAAPAEPGPGPGPGEDVAAAADAATPTEPPVATPPQPATEPAVEPTAPEPAAAVAPTSSSVDGERYVVAAGTDGGPPYYDDADLAALRTRHGIEVEPLERTDGPRWRCLIADPACGRSFEINALSAYTYRGRQSSVAGVGEDPRWSSGRAQYDFWMNLPVMTEVAGNKLFSRMTLGPKGGLIFSDGGSTWGNLGMAFRYWMGRGRWAPTVEFSSALTFKIGERSTKNAALQDPKWKMTRGPVGFTADVGFGLGGFGAIVLGGQYDSPLAREDIPEQYRTSAGGAFFVGFRGNILWGAPAAAAVATHAVTQRSVETP
ncbi:MAG: hypothetical protein ACRBN8_05605 [Nannocystales bacterium]